ncbi:hypothetical protein LTR85_010582 [Meristemomyces frigidus]|nr:hypothetical protein LTR85_010582 [Meristemomyces frigidus]
MADFDWAPVANPWKTSSEDFGDPKALNEQTASEKAMTYSLIKQQYRDYATQSDFVLTQEVQGQWIQIIAAALAQEVHFWTLCLDNAVGLYVASPPTVHISKDWLVGVYLPGFYDTYDSFDDGYNDFLAGKEDTIAGMAEQSIRMLLQTAEDELEAAEAQPTAAAPLDPVTKEMVALFELVKQDKEEAANINRLQRTLRSLGPTLASLPKSQAVFGRYQDLAASGQKNVLDDFGEQCVQLLRAAAPQTSIKKLADLTDEEKSQLALATSSDFLVGETAKQQRKTATDDAPKSKKKSKKVEKAQARPGAQISNLLEEPPAQLKWLEDTFSEYPGPVTYPSWSTLTVPPFQVEHVHIEFVRMIYGPKGKKAIDMQEDDQAKERIETELQLGPGDMLKKIWRRSSSFVVGRMLSDKEAEQNIPDSRTLLEKCVGEVSRRLPNNVYFYQQLFARLATKMGDLTEREPRAVEEKQDNIWHAYSEKGFYDNWFHVRKLLQALAFYLDDQTAKDTLSTAECDLLRLLAAIQGASSTPLAWLLCVEYVLRTVWRLCLSLKDNTSDGTSKAKGKQRATSITDESWIRIQNIFKELAAFAQGAAIYAVVPRFKYSRLFKQLQPGTAGLSAEHDRLLDWYIQLYKFDPRCANPDCNRLLPRPGRFRTLTGIKEVFSVASRDVRGGNKSVRAFVSTNREDIYPCFISCINSRQPTAALIVLFFYYSHLYHSVPVGCKTARGKRSIAGFA